MTKYNSKYWYNGAAGGIDLFRANNFNHQFKRHFHEEWVIAVYEGGIEHCRFGSEQKFARRGDVLLIPPYCSHAGGPANEFGWSYRAFYPPTKLIDEILGYPCGWQHKVRLIRNSNFWSRLYASHLLMEGKSDESTFKNAIAEAITAADEQMQLFSKTSIKIIEKRKKYLLAKEIREYIREYYIEPLSIDDMAQEFNCSLTHIIRTFTAQYSISPHAYIIHLKLNKAKIVLRLGANSVEAALDAGFSDQSHMIRHFLSNFGATPGNYVRNIQY